MRVYEAYSFDEIYKELLTDIRDQGELEAKTRELVNVTLVLKDVGQSFLPLNKNWKWAFQELFDRMSGLFDFSEMYQNPGKAYGYRPSWRKKLEKEKKN